MMADESVWKTVTAVPELKLGDVHVWKLLLSDCLTALSHEILSEDEIRRAERFQFPVDRDRFVRTRTTLRRLLSRYCAISAGTMKFSYNRYGKPFLHNTKQAEGIFFNVTHSKNIVLLAVSRECETGIDVEYMRDTEKYLQLAERFFSRKEYLALACLSGTALKRGFYRCWTCKEAFVKAIGSGLLFPLADFTVNLEDEEKPCLDWVEPRSFSGKCRLFPLPLADGYCASLACLTDPQQISLYRCSHELSEFS